MMKPACLLTIAALGAALNRAGALDNQKGKEIAFEQVGSHALARDELLARAIACEDMPCMERELDDELIHSAVRPFMITRNAKTEKAEEGAQARSSCCTETPCYYDQCKRTCNFWQRFGGVTCCSTGPCGSSSFTSPTEPGSINTGTCYNKGERSSGAEGYELVSYKPCCDGRAPVKKVGEWGKFCPDESNGGDGGYSDDGAENSSDGSDKGGYTTVPPAFKTEPPAYATASPPYTTASPPYLATGGEGDKYRGDIGNGSSECYGPGMRSMGAEGYPAVEYKPCCDGRAAVKRISEWGMFCPAAAAASGEDEALADGTGSEEGETQEGMLLRYTQTVRTKVLQLTRSCTRKHEAETIDCVQRELDAVLERASQDETSEFRESRSQCCIEDENYYCQCRNTCCFWQGNRFAAPDGLFPPSNSYSSL